MCTTCRAITRILGDWWANLETPIKKCYIDLATQVIKNYKALPKFSNDTKSYCYIFYTESYFFRTKMRFILLILISNGINFLHLH